MSSFPVFFPGGAAGVGLIALRLGISLIIPGLAQSLIDDPFWVACLIVPAVAMICAGFCVRWVAGLTVLVCLTILVVGGPLDAVDTLALALGTLALALLGPGAYSIDARIFGRRRVVLTTRSDGSE